MNILFSIDSLTGGGAEKLLLRYISILKKNRVCDITLFVINGYGPLLNNIPSGIRMFVGSNLSDYDVELFNQLVFDIEIGFLEGYAIKFIALRNSSALKIGWIHTDILHNNWCKNYYKNGFQEECYNRMDFLVCVNEFCKKRFEIAFPHVTTNIIVCNNVLDFDLLDNSICHLSNMDTMKLCFVGRLTSEKHPETIILAIKELLLRGHAVTLDILGEGYMHEALSAQIQSNKLGDNIRLLGYISNPYDNISRCDVLVSESEIEGGPLNMAEAYYLGLPIIATHSGGSDDFNRSFGGVKFTDGSVNDLVRVLEETYDNNAHHLIEFKKHLIPSKIKETFGPEHLLSLFDYWHKLISHT